MSESSKQATDSQDHRSIDVPRAMIHKNILDAAEARPDATMSEIASDVTGASTELVEQVLDEYGDPIEVEPSTNSANIKTKPSMSSMEDVITGDVSSQSDDTVGTTNDVDGLRVNLDDLSEKQYETLRLIFQEPELTQNEIAERFDVTASTINERLNSIDGFEWANRQSIVERIFDRRTTELMESAHIDQQNKELTDRVAALEETIQQLETKLEDGSASQDAWADTDLLVKMLHASLDSDQITKEEELEIIERFCVSQI